MNWKTSDPYGTLMTQKRCVMCFRVKKIPRVSFRIILYADIRGQGMVKTSNLAEKDMKDPEKIWDALQTRVKPKTNKYNNVDRLHLRTFGEKMKLVISS